MFKDTPSLGLTFSGVNHESFSQKVTLPESEMNGKKRAADRLHWWKITLEKCSSITALVMNSISIYQFVLDLSVIV